MKHHCHVIILAAGKGSRMNSDLPKVMHKVGGVPMLSKVIESASRITDDITIVYSHHLAPYLDDYQGYHLVLQEFPLGTAHAVFSALNKRMLGPVLVLYADNPFLSSHLMRDLLNHLEENEASIASLAFMPKDPTGYGRVITDAAGNFIKIQECKDARPEEKAVNLCNSGIMAFAPNISQKVLSIIMNSKSDKEYYLTDAIAVASSLNMKVTFMVAKDNNEVIGVNNQEELLFAQNIMGLT